MSESTWEQLAQQAHEEGRATWPGVELPREHFTRHLAQLLLQGAERERPPGAVELALGRLKVADLYLACACALRVPGAVEALEEHFLSQVREEVRQQVRTHLLVGTEGRGPRIAEYAGRGTLKSWVRVIATRLLRHPGRTDQEELLDEEVNGFADMASPGPDAELEHIRRHLEPAFREALREAFQALPEEQRHLLRLRHLKRLTHAAMARLFEVPQPTLLRRLALAYVALFEETKRRLRTKLE